MLGGAADKGDSRTGAAPVQAGDLCSGTVTAIIRGALEVALDGFPGLVPGVVGPLDRGWPRLAEAEVKVGDRITAGVIAVDTGRGRVWLSVAAAANQERCCRGTTMRTRPRPWVPR